MLDVIAGFSCVDVVGDDDCALQAPKMKAHVPISNRFVNFINLTLKVKNCFNN
jgi:hypothetical protein